MKNIFTDEQIKAYRAVKRAIDKAFSLGLRFYGKQQDLIAYTEKDSNWMDKVNDPFSGKGEIIPFLYGAKIHDSGADDYPRRPS